MLRGPKPLNRAMSKTARQLFAEAYSRGIPRRVLAKKIGVSLMTVNVWASGARDMGMTDLETLASFLDLEIALLPKEKRDV